jgi:hypothetical protein
MFEDRERDVSANVAREKAVYEYATALEDGDIDTLIAVLQKAERDPVLEEMVLEVHQFDEAKETADIVEETEVGSESFQGMAARRTPASKKRRMGRRLRLERVQRFGGLLRGLAAVLVVGALLGSILLVLTSRQPGVGGTPQGAIHWQGYDIPNPGTGDTNLNGVAAISRNDVWAVGGYAKERQEYPLLEHWDGSQWSVVRSNTPGYLYGVTAISSDDVWAVGITDSQKVQDVKALIEHWDGHTWSLVNSPGAESYSVLYSVSATGPDDVWAVGLATDPRIQARNGKGLIEHWDGKRWSIIDSPNGHMVESTFYSVKAISSRDVWAVGYFYADATPYSPYYALIVHWNGRQWNVVSSPAGSGSMRKANILYAVTGLSSDDIWATGGTCLQSSTPSASNPCRPLVEHWDGTRWSDVSTPSTGHKHNNLYTATALSSHDVWAAGSFYNLNSDPSIILVEHWDGRQWKLVQSPGYLEGTWISGMTQVAGAKTLWMVGTTTQNGSAQMSARIIRLDF